MGDAFHQARTTVDKFHVAKMRGDSVDQIRRREMRSKGRSKIGLLEGTRYRLL